MKIYDTLTAKVKEFKPIKEGKINMYVCGPTVYDHIHIGNARPIVIFDCLRRYFEYLGYVVTYVQNFTDVDDKIIKRANEENIKFEDLIEKYIKEYEIVAEKLFVKKPTFAPRVTLNMDSILDLIKTLVEKKHAYVSDGNVYFDVSSFKEYGKLSKKPLEDLEQGEDVVSSNLKKDKLDFALWKKTKEGEPFWESLWGKGRPGWHIECSAMAIKYLGESIDLHCGGIDLIFPHHENEIAQSEAATGKKFSKYWMHNGHVNVNGQKMSKSLGNFFTVKEIGEKYGYEALRFLIIQAHYKMPINFTKETLVQAKSSLQRIYNFKNNIQFILEKLKGQKQEKKQEDGNLKEQLKKFNERFFSALDYDFNTAIAVSIIFEFIRWSNCFLNEELKCDFAFLEEINKIFLNFIEILGIAQTDSCYTVPKEVLEIYEQRKKAREEKNFKLADELREKINKMGYHVEETRKGVRIFPKNKN